MLRSRNRQFETYKTLAAWHAATTINCNGMVSEHVTVDRLLGRDTTIDLSDPDALSEVLELERAANDG